MLKHTKYLIWCIVLPTSLFSQIYDFTIQTTNKRTFCPTEIVMHTPLLNKVHQISLGKSNSISDYSYSSLSLKNILDENEYHFSKHQTRKMLENSLVGSITFGLFGFVVGGFNRKTRLGTAIGSSFGSMLGLLYYKKRYNPKTSLTKALVGSVLGGTAAYFIFTSSKSSGVAIFKLFGALVLPPLCAHITIHI